ncbi:MAG: diguanylate cyclase [bacterium]
MKKILILEDSSLIANAIREKVGKNNFLECDTASSLTEAKYKIEDNLEKYFLGVIDLNLPDAQGDKTVDYFLSKGISPIVFTAEYSDEIRDRIISKKVIDYIIKSDERSMDYLVYIIERIYKNQFIKVMVVDDSSLSRQYLTDILKVQKFIVLEARNGFEALTLLVQNKDIKLIITDFMMDKINGFELTRKIRRYYSSKQLAIIGISAYGSVPLSVKFLKSGANDFITKPFVEEEFCLRIRQNIEILEQFEQLDAYKRLSHVDYLTQVYNRCFFFEIGNKIFENAKRKNVDITTVMLDIDHFKSINDTYGHDIGDLVLKHVAQILSKNLRATDILARYGGEEFCILAINLKKENTLEVFERLRLRIEQSKLEVKNSKISVSVSLGVTTRIFDSLESNIKHADDLLYKAKQQGRNCVVVD